MKRGSSEFLPLGEAVVHAVTGSGGRHAALIEDAFDVLIETPGGGLLLHGEADARRDTRRVIDSLERQVGAGLTASPADIRVAIDAVRSGVKGASPHVRRGQVAAKTAAQARYLEALGAHDLVFGMGPAGTGKTFLAVAHGAGLLRSGAVERLVVTRPAVEAGERLGFLPGDLTEKVDPYMAPVWEALSAILGAEALRKRRERGEIEVAPIAFMRGRTLSHAYVIVDEAQNTTRLQMKMVLTRLGEGSSMAVTGDPSQVDLINAGDSGLAHAVSILEGVEGVAISRFTAADVVRHPLVGRIVEAYDADAAPADPMIGAGAAEAEIDVEIEAEGWTRALPDVEALTRDAATAALRGRAHGELAILLTDDDAVRTLNERFRGKDAATNVLSFPASAPAFGSLGDVALAFGVCAREAREQGKTLGDHVSHLVIHGVLHLLGYDHEDDAQAEVMESLETAILAGLGVTDPYASEHEDDAAKDSISHG